MLKHTPAAARPREPTAEELQRGMDEVHARVSRLNRVTYLAGQLTAAELEGAIVLLEAAHRCREALAGLTSVHADQALVYVLDVGF